MSRREFLWGLTAGWLVRPGWAAGGTPVNRALTAALAEFFQDPSGYARIYREYLGLEPRLVPGTVSAAWPAATELMPLLSRGELRLGYCYNPPYHLTSPGGRPAGIDYDLGLALMARLRRRYGARLRLRWVEKPVGVGGDEQLAMYRAMIAALQAGEIDAALSGLLIIEDQPVAWTCPSELLFTGIFYTGRDGLDLAFLKGKARGELVKYLATRPEEFSFLATVNGGPSVQTNQALVDQVVAAGGRARALTGTVTQLQAALKEAPVHFVVGDALSLSYYCNQPGFGGVNLNMPASDNVLPLAPFTLP